MRSFQVESSATPHESTTPASGSDSVRNSNMKLQLRGLQKDVKVPYSYKLSKMVSKILAQSPVACAPEDVVVVALRWNLELSRECTQEVGMFSGEKLGCQLVDLGLMPNDIIHVVAPLPPDWHLCEDAEGKVASCVCKPKAGRLARRNKCTVLACACMTWLAGRCFTTIA